VCLRILPKPAGDDSIQNLPILTENVSKLDESEYTTQRDVAYSRVLSGDTLSGEGKPSDAEAKVKMHIGNTSVPAEALKQNAIFPGADEVLLHYLDSLYKETIDPSDQSMFTDLTKHMEPVFLEDMDNLNVLRPDVITRVTEYMPQIAKFVQQIVDNGCAYEAEGSVYFDIAAFQKAGNTYARLRPESGNDKALRGDGEASLSTNLGGKRGADHFALWKNSKAGEPYWPSKWGDG
jgi:cysteinyl-tRNA synthetase